MKILTDFSWRRFVTSQLLKNDGGGGGGAECIIGLLVLKINEGYQWILLRMAIQKTKY